MNDCKYFKKATAWSKANTPVIKGNVFFQLNEVKTPFRTSRGHVFGGLDWLEPDKRDLHGAEQANDKEGVVSNVNPCGVAVHKEEGKNMKRDL